MTLVSRRVPVNQRWAPPHTFPMPAGVALMAVAVLLL